MQPYAANVYPFLMMICCSSLFVFLTSCGYQYGPTSKLAGHRTLSIPFVEGDLDGELTSELVKQIAQSGIFEYKREGGALLLQVDVIDTSDENIGFRYDCNKKGKIKKRLISDETRTSILVEVSVLETGTNTIVLGPVRLSANVEFDHDYYSSRNGINIFSLGQLTDYDEAHTAARRPLHYTLARKIVDYLNNNW